MTGLAALAEAEVRARHRFFEAWFTGTASVAAMRETERVFAPDMRMITPDGQQHDAAGIVAYLRTCRGTRAQGFAIRIVLTGTLDLGPDAALLLYDEDQTDAQGVSTRRRSSAIFSPDASLPGGVVWRHLHESWIFKQQPEKPAPNME